MGSSPLKERDYTYGCRDDEGTERVYVLGPRRKLRHLELALLRDTKHEIPRVSQFSTGTHEYIDADISCDSN
jgi:hypothetical protein